MERQKQAAALDEDAGTQQHLDRFTDLTRKVLTASPEGLKEQDAKRRGAKQEEGKPSQVRPA